MRTLRFVPWRTRNKRSDWSPPAVTESVRKKTSIRGCMNIWQQPCTSATRFSWRGRKIIYLEYLRYENFILSVDFLQYQCGSIDFLCIVFKPAVAAVFLNSVPESRIPDQGHRSYVARPVFQRLPRRHSGECVQERSRVGKGVQAPETSGD